MSSFTHSLEEDILNQHIKVDGLEIGLSRQDGNRRGLINEDWYEDEDGDMVPPDEGLDEPGNGYYYDNEDEMWKTEDGDTVTTYSRQSIGSADWHDVDVVLGEDGDSELRLSENVSFGELEEGEDWGNISHFFITDGTDNVLCWGSMPDSFNPVEGMEVKIWANTIVVRMTD